MVSQLLVMSFFSGQLISLFSWSALKVQSRLGKRRVISSLSAIFFLCDRAMKSRLSLRCLTALKTECPYAQVCPYFGTALRQRSVPP